MKIGYPCINRSIGCRANSTFRLASYSENRLFKTIKNNLDCLERILSFNREEGFLFFRVSSDTIPFASHPVCDYDWETAFQQQLGRIGQFIKTNDIRISMHPDQFTLINSPKEDIVMRSKAELLYHARLLEAMDLDEDAKVQIHVGGVYGNKDTSIVRFLKQCDHLPEIIRKRLIIENDERLYNLQDCLFIHENTGIPVLFDSFHHLCYNSGETVREALLLAGRTWGEKDGRLMVDYSNQQEGKRDGKHAESLNPQLFRDFLIETDGLNYDLMLEIKDKEKSATVALQIIEEFFK